MIQMSKERLLTGVMVALATPLDERGKIDDDGVTRLLDNLMSYTLSGVCPVGSTGEGPLLDRETRVRITLKVSERIPPGIWNIPASMSNILEDVIEDLSAYADAGAHAVLVTPPFYYHHNAEAVKQWYELVVDKSPLPIVLYNIPTFTKISIQPEVVAHLALDPRVIGIKDSSRDLEYFENVVAASRSSVFSVLTGSDSMLLACGILGGSGTIAASVNVVPGMVTSLWDAINTGSWETARELQNKLLEIVKICREPGFPFGWKAALSLQGVCSNYVASPNLPASESAVKRLALRLDEVGVVLGSRI